METVVAVITEDGNCWGYWL